MIPARILTVCLLMGASSLGFAHAHLIRASPAEGSTLASPPDRFVLRFGEPARLTVLSLQKEGQEARKIGPLPAAAAAEFSIPAPALSVGKYVLSWRAVGDDGHVVPGKLTFSIAP